MCKKQIYVDKAKESAIMQLDAGGALDGKVTRVETCLRDAALCGVAGLSQRVLLTDCCDHPGASTSHCGRTQQVLSPGKVSYRLTQYLKRNT